MRCKTERLNAIREADARNNPAPTSDGQSSKEIVRDLRVTREPASKHGACVSNAKICANLMMAIGLDAPRV